MYKVKIEIAMFIFKNMKSTFLFPVSSAKPRGILIKYSIMYSTLVYYRI